MVHGVPLLQERGLSREVATDVLAALWVGMIVSQPALGYLLDRYDTPRIALPFALLAALGLLLLLLGGPPALLWGAVFLIGLAPAARPAPPSTSSAATSACAISA